MVRRAFRTWDGRVLVESTGTFGALRTLVRYFFEAKLQYIRKHRYLYTDPRDPHARSLAGLTSKRDSN